MTRPFYSDYVRHAMRYYSRNLQAINFKNLVDRENWNACHDIVLRYSDRDKDILISVYGGFDTLADNVYETAKKHNVNQNVIWDMMKDFERVVACRRGLIWY